jgi:nitroimidazol reductase NimA-like FMN-containing flavoprotein (pyridoxamine 5'-phosphate oxidase superfamily)
MDRNNFRPFNFVYQMAKIYFFGMTREGKWISKSHR